MGIISIIPYDHGLEQLAKLAVRRELIPFFGAGFTAGCPACEGAVPNSKLAMSSMQKLILQSTSELTAEDLETLDFYTLSDLFFQYVSPDDRAKYFEQNYTDVTIFKNQKDFLSVVDWPYAYTLNVDDGIERNSEFKPIFPYHKLRRPHTSKKLLYKLHGDALYESQYADSAENIVFSQPQYLQAITSEENTDIYEALLSDYGQRHILFIGCSLQSEQDLMYVYRKSSEFQQETYRIALRRTEPTILEQRNLKNHGVNQILLVDSYERFYDDFVEKYKEIQEETRKTVYEHLNPSIYSIENKAESLKLLAGENIFDFANNRFLKGSFHILREAVNQVAKEITNKQCVLLKGRRFSGKTYVLCSLAERFKTKDIFYFPSTSFVDEEIVEGLLLGNKNCLFLFDSNSITPDVYGMLIKLGSDLQQNNNTLIIAVNSSDNYMSTQMNTAVVEINNRFNIGDELNLSCKVLDAFGLTRRTSSQTNLDYLYVLRKDQNVSIPFDDKTNVMFTSAEKRVLLALCALDKLYYSDLIALNFTHKEILAFCSKMEPLVELVPTGPNESTRHSALKLVHNSKLALIELLHAFSEKDICDSVFYIVKKFKPDYHRRRLYIEIILFDTLNQLFSKKQMQKKLLQPSTPIFNLCSSQIFTTGFSVQKVFIEWQTAKRSWMMPILMQKKYI